jgi:type II secretory pathway component HofQ
MRRRGQAWLWPLVALAAALGTATAMAQDLEIIELQHRRAEDVIPIVQPLLDPGGVLSGVDDKLLVRTTPANLAQIREAVAAIDRPQRQLLITVGQGTVTGSTQPAREVRRRSVAATSRSA